MMYFVGAFTQNYAMGKDGHLPWRDTPMKHDTARLEQLITGKTLVMGERTYHDYKDIGKTFQTKNVWVLSKNKKSLPGAKIRNNVQEVTTLAKHQDIWVIGGGQIFKTLLPYADVMYLTRIEAVLPGDTFFPQYNESEWSGTEQHFLADEDNPYPYTFIELRRKH
jgi:dihydrofolate reductase